MLPYVDPVPELKSQLAREIVARIERPGAVTTAQFTVIGGPRLSNLRLSRLDRFSVQGLIRTLVRLGYEVEITLTQPEQFASVRSRPPPRSGEARCSRRGGGPGPSFPS